MFRDHDVAGLLAAQGVIPSAQVLHHVTVAHLRLPQRDAVALHRQLQPEVGHHRRDQRVALQLAAVLHRQREDRHNLVPIDDVALRVHGEAAVGVAVVRQAQVRTMLDDGLLQLVDVRGTDTVVDVVAIRLIRHGNHLGARGLVCQRGGLVRRAVGAVHHDLDAVQAGVHRLLQVVQVAVQCAVGLVEDPADGRAGGAFLRELAHLLLDLVFDPVLELAPADGEELDAVIRHWVVARGDHHAHVGAIIVGQERDGRGGQHAHVEHVHPLRGHACGQGGGEHLPRHARVPADDRGRAAVSGLLFRQYPGRRRAQPHSQRGGQLLVCKATDTVGSEQSSHGSIAYKRPATPPGCGASGYGGAPENGPRPARTSSSNYWEEPTPPPATSGDPPGRRTPARRPLR